MTIDSIQSYLIEQGVSGQRQCKLGYDTSPQCDSFQLGEMVRFFKRIGTANLQVIMAGTMPLLPYPGDLEHLLTTLRQCPNYQIDRNHGHCGIRSRLVKMVMLVQSMLEYIGICRWCWQHDRGAHSWFTAISGARWRPGCSEIATEKEEDGRQSDCWRERNDHRKARRLFTATTHEWSLID